MMKADLEELMVVSCLFPSMKWSSSGTRPVLVAREGNVLRLYWMPLLLWLDECCAERFIEQLNRKARASA
ncbi:MAG: hypothetical protein GTN60_12245 [Pseudomonas stutzeri]|nr:hypothetical protein [Stutzerimonas stutzeri]NIV38610.1 hypothetical protein [Anaerolineae bacterium]NIM53174.1 hypothetical protein [Stutzerimonas stutzeri]NIM87494.1 hypothetical protein [Stutzerimonas stutzeri]NIN82186.1 hypothetical protein [Stutzerimonas stutzeri]